MLNEPGVEAKARRLLARCTELRSYIETNEGALIDYGQRSRAGKPISISRAEGTVDQLVTVSQLVNARMNKRRQMRWSPRGTHRVLQVRAALLDRQLGHQAIQLAAQRPRFLTLPRPGYPRPCERDWSTAKVLLRTDGLFAPAWARQLAEEPAHPEGRVIRARVGATPQAPGWG